jgi:hypothetical protein
MLKSNVSARIYSEQFLGVLFVSEGVLKVLKLRHWFHILVTISGRETESFLDFLGQAILNILTPPSICDFHQNVKSPQQGSTFELNQLKSAPSQVLPVFFSGFDRLQTCCHSFGLANILYFFQVPANFFFIVMTIGQELGH